jgi:hypothetical protein
MDLRWLVRLRRVALGLIGRYAMNDSASIVRITGFECGNEKMMQTVNFDGQKQPSIFQLQSVVSSLEKHGEGDAVEDQDGGEFSLDRLAGGLAIGDNNGDVMFLDPSDGFSVWLYHHDGFDVELLAGSFAEWIRDAELD